VQLRGSAGAAVGVIAGLVLLSLVSACGHEDKDPEQVALDAVRAAADDDCEALADLVNREMDCDDGDAMEHLGSLRESTSDGVEVKDVRTNEGAALVTLELHGELDGGVKHDSLREVGVIKTDDGWKVHDTSDLLRPVESSGSLTVPPGTTDSIR